MDALARMLAGDRQGSIYLTPAVYLPLTSFVDAALGILQVGPVVGSCQGG